MAENSSLRSYDPDAHVLTLGDIEVVGAAEGSMFAFSPTSQTWETKVGAKGAVVRQKRHDRTATMTVRLQYGSPTNARLSALHQADIDSNDGKGALLLKDLNGTTRIEAAEAWVAGWPEYDIGADAPDVEWTIMLASAKVVIGEAA